MKPLSGNISTVLRRLSVLTILALGGVLAVTAAEARRHVLVNIGVSGYFGGGYLHWGYPPGDYGGPLVLGFFYRAQLDVVVAPLLPFPPPLRSPPGGVGAE